MNSTSNTKPTLSIYIGQPGFEEKKYTAVILFSVILGYDCRFFAENSSAFTRIVFPNGFIVRIEDAFFARAGEGRYIDSGMLPASPMRLDHPAAPEGHIAFLYGEPFFSEDAGTVTLRADIIASAFFLLSRWEEIVIEAKDGFGRVPNDALFVRRFNLSARPLVNEYAEWIARMASESGETIPPKPGKFEIVPTHDVDRLYFQGLGLAFSTALKNRLPKRFLTWFLYRLFGIRQERTFRTLMKLSESKGLRSRFYWMSGGIYPFDRYYDLADKQVAALLSEIRERGHLIGFHPSYRTMEDETAWGDERKKLEERLGFPVSEGRQHYLRFAVPRSAQIWNSQEMEVDSSFGFSRGVGFRCGTGVEYPLFDFQNRRPLRIKERPLLIMDAAIRKGALREQDLRDVHSVIAKCRAYDMPCTILFHNHVLDPVPWNGLRGLYTKILEDHA